MFGYWHEWLDRADRSDFNLEFPSGFSVPHDVNALGTKVSEFKSRHEEGFVPDLRKTDILNRRLITSRKRTRNLFDLTSLWKKMVLETLDERVSEEVMETEPTVRNSHVDDVQVYLPPNVNIAEVDSDSDRPTIHHRRSPPAPDTWTYGRTR